MTCRALVFALAVLALLLGSSPANLALAQSEDESTDGEQASGEAADPADADRMNMARAHFEVGRTAFSEGRFEDALTSFRRSYEMSGNAILLFNIGASLDRLRRNEEALDTFEHYLRVLPDADNRAEVEGRMRSIRDVLRRERERDEEARVREAERQRLADELAAERDGGVLDKWWFWTIVGGVLVAGGAVALGIALYDPGVEEPLLGTTQQVGYTLTWGGP